MGGRGKARKIYGWQGLWWYYEDQYLVVRLPFCICKPYIKISSCIVTLETRITMCWGKKGIHLQGLGFLIWSHPYYPHPEGHAETNLFLFCSSFLFCFTYLFSSSSFFSFSLLLTTEWPIWQPCLMLMFTALNWVQTTGYFPACWSLLEGLRLSPLKKKCLCFSFSNRCRNLM